MKRRTFLRGVVGAAAVVVVPLPKLVAYRQGLIITDKGIQGVVAGPANIPIYELGCAVSDSFYPDMYTRLQKQTTRWRA